jgi:hypothetical protein
MRGMRFKTGEQIPYSGIYKVIHRQHRLPHQVTLLRGETFPRCAKCGDLVAFILVQAVSLEDGLSSFRVRLYVLPELDDTLPIAS